MGNTVYEVRFLKNLLSKFNASMLVKCISHEELFIEHLRDTISLHGKCVGKSMTDFTYPHGQSMLVAVVPHAKPYSEFAAYLQNRTWTLLFAYIFVVIVSSSLVLVVSGYVKKRKILLFECVIDVVNLLLNDNTAIKYRNLFRAEILVIVPLTFTGLIVMNGIASLFQSYITAPIYQPQINSFRDMYTSSVPIMANKIVGRDRIVELLESFTRYGGWNNRVIGVAFKQLSDEIATLNNSIAFFVDYDEASVLLEVQKKMSVKAYHLLGEHFFYKQLISFGFTPHFPFIECVNDIIHRLSRAGLTDKWGREGSERIAKTLWKLNLNREMNNEVSSIGEFAVPTIVWCGWIASTVVFICEIFWHKIKLN